MAWCLSSRVPPVGPGPSHVTRQATANGILFKEKEKDFVVIMRPKSRNSRLLQSCASGEIDQKGRQRPFTLRPLRPNRIAAANKKEKMRVRHHRDQPSPKMGSNKSAEKSANHKSN
jgi:hypothetical protein